MIQNKTIRENVSTPLTLINSRQVRFGFALVNGRLEECPEEQRVLSLLRGWWTKGLSNYVMAARLDELGISTKRGEGHWAPGFVAKLIKREVF